MPDLKRIIDEQFNLHKNIQVQDIYKLFFQGANGCEHIITDYDSAWAFFDNEYELAKPPENQEAIIEELAQNSKFCRVNIRPHKILVNNKLLLFNAFLESSTLKGKNIDIKKLWDDFKNLNRNEKYFEEETVLEFDKFLYKENFPAIHHSETYTLNNNPAYRVVNIYIYQEKLKKKLKLFCPNMYRA